MFVQMLKKQTTFVHDVAQAEQYSPFRMSFNEKSQRYVVKNIESELSIVAAGLELEEAEACVMFKANEHIFRKIQKQTH